MNNKKTQFSIRLIDGLSQVIFWFFAGVTGIFLVFIFLNAIGVMPADMTIGIDFPTNFSVVEEGIFTSGDKASSVSITEASGTIKIQNPPRLLSVVLSLAILPLLGVLLYMLWLFKGFTRNVKRGNVFEKVNIRNLKIIAYLLAGTWVYQQTLVTLYNTIIIPKLEFDCLMFGYSHGAFGSLLLFALFLWVLSHIFEKGAEIEAENHLTV